MPKRGASPMVWFGSPSGFRGDCMFAAYAAGKAWSTGVASIGVLRKETLGARPLRKELPRVEPCFNSVQGFAYRGAAVVF